MISGDNQKVAEAVAQTVGLTEAQGDLMPEQKVEEIKKLRTEHGKVAMVGDGVNDGPAMANATVGIAMGAAGSDVALETADVALMADDLAQLPFAVGLSRSTSRVIKQNLWMSLGVVAVLIPATVLGLNIGTAVIFHEGSTCSWLPTRCGCWPTSLSTRVPRQLSLPRNVKTMGGGPPCLPKTVSQGS
jgi:Cd2+/Zn2+-exporting ATPase